MGRPLLRIVGNEARNRARSRGRRERLAQRAAAAQAVSGGAAPPPEADVFEEEHRCELFAALDRLPPDERLAVIGRFFFGLTDAEAAAALGVRRGTVKMRIFRALERLRRELGGGGAVNELERRLVEAAPHYPFPATPDMGAAVLPRLPARPRRDRRPLVVAVAAAAAALAAVLAFSSGLEARCSTG